MISNLIFDWSGTLVDDFSYTLAVTNQMFNERGLAAWNVDDFKEKFFLPHVQFYQNYFPEMTHAEVDSFFKNHFAQFEQNLQLLPYALEFLEYCKNEKIPLFLLSAIHKEYYEERSAALGVAGYFTQAYVASTHKDQTLKCLLAEHKLAPEQTLFVGDMRHDIEAARHCGVLSAGVLTGYDSRAKLEEARPDFLFEDLSYLLNYVKQVRLNTCSLFLGQIV